MDLFKDIIHDLMIGGEGLINNEQDEKEYVPYVVNMALSKHIDCIGHANEMNMRPQLRHVAQNDYHLNSVRKYKRPFRKWDKAPVKPDDVMMLQEYYGYSYQKAREVGKILTPNQIDEIRKRLEKGGLSSKNERRTTK